MRVHRFLLPAIAFMSGFALMTFELIAARILAPSIGSSTYIWTSVIGVIIAALSIGYWAGGKVADTRSRASDIAWLLLFTACTVGATLLLYLPYIDTVTQTPVDTRLQGVVASLLLFAPTSFLIGMLSPYLVKLQITSLQTSGRSFASLSALESIGGITGTFVTGFILFGYIGVRESLVVVITVLLVASWLIAPRRHMTARLAITAIVVIGSLALLQLKQPGQIETASAHYTIHDGTQSGRPVRGIATGPGGTQSGVYLDQPNELLFWYTQRLAEVVAVAPSDDRILVLGGGAFTLPRYLANTYPDSQIDVVEIDPELADVARQYFYYDDPDNINLIFDDARRYVNSASTQYDIVLVDVYSDADVPFSFMTSEYGQELAQIVKPNGVVAVNMIAGMAGACSELLRALDAPYRASWSSAQYTQQTSTSVRGNVVVAYANAPLDWRTSRPLNMSVTTPYGDNYAPAERLQQSCRQSDE